MDKVVFIGNFTGGSFGRAGDPSRTYAYFALTSDIDAETASRGTAHLIAFRDKGEAEGRLVGLKLKSTEEVVSAAHLRETRQNKLTLGRHIRAAIEGHIGEVVRTLRWGDQVRPPKTMCKETAALLKSAPAGGWDAVADGRSYRVWLTASGLASRVVEMAPVVAGA